MPARKSSAAREAILVASTEEAKAFVSELQKGRLHGRELDRHIAEVVGGRKFEDLQAIARRLMIELAGGPVAQPATGQRRPARTARKAPAKRKAPERGGGASE